MNEVGELLRALDRERTAAVRLDERFAEWWAARDDRAHDLLDELARRAATQPPALAILLELLGRHRVARPALWRVLVTESDVDDAEQATLARVASRVDDFAGRSRFATWLHQIAANEAKQLIRARSRRPSTPTDRPDVEPFVARLSTLLADRDLVERALAALPADDREPLVLREVDGLGYDEIAIRLGVPVGTVRSRLHRARGSVAAWVNEQLEAGS